MQVRDTGMQNSKVHWWNFDIVDYLYKPTILQSCVVAIFFLKRSCPAPPGRQQEKKPCPARLAGRQCPNSVWELGTRPPPFQKVLGVAAQAPHLLSFPFWQTMLYTLLWRYRCRARCYSCPSGHITWAVAAVIV